MNLAPVLPKVAVIKLLIMISLVAMGSSYLNYTCYAQNALTLNVNISGYATTNCDSRCIRYGSGTPATYCCTGLNTTTNYDCLYGCNPAYANNYQWPQVNQPTRCDSYCPPHYYVLPTDPSGTVCKKCHDWCGNCNDTGEYYCTSCDPAAYRLNSSACYNYATQSYGSYNPCINGYYGLQIQMICVACPTGCAQCSIYLTWEMPGSNFTANYNQTSYNCTGDPLCAYTTMCYSCINGYTFMNGMCYSNSQCLTYSYYTSVGATFNPSSCNCFANYYILGLSICIKCHISCLTCSGSSTASCLTCPTGSSNTTATTLTSCAYNQTYSQIENWVGGTPNVPASVSTSGWYKSAGVLRTNVNQMSCTSSEYVFGYYGYNNNNTLYFDGTKAIGINLFPVGSKLVYNQGSLVAHYGVHLRATLLFIDQWKNGISILFQENGANAFSFSYQMEGIAGEYLCGLNYDDHLDVVDNWFQHNRSSIVDLTIKASNDQLAWGIKQIILHVLKCHISCSSCKGPTSSDCTGCPANQTVVNGVCVCNSTSGYYNNSGACDLNCGANMYKNPYTYTCVSNCSWPYTFGHNSNGSLECVINCPEGYYQNYSNNVCVSSCYQSNITNPANNFYMYDGANRMCNNTCPTGTFGDPQSGACVRTCPTYDNTTNDGYFANGSFCYEVCPSASLFAYVPQRSCLSTCPMGLFKNYKSKNNATASICEQQCSVTLGGQYLYGDNSTGKCTNYCSSGTYGDIDTNLCLSVCNGSAFGQSLLVNATSGLYQRLCVINCSVANNLYGNPLTGFCVSPSGCPTNYYADPLTALCTRTCNGTDYFGDNATHMCINTSCSNHGFKDNQTKVCLKTCLHNDSMAQYGDNLTGYCIPGCYGIYYADEQHNMECVTICSASPSSTFGLNNQCVGNCSNQTWADVYNPSRTCTNSCLFTSTLKSYGLNDTRQCVKTCPDYQFADISTGVPLCKIGCPVNPNSNLTGLFGNVKDNICETTCPAPYYGDQTGNRICVLQCPWPYFGQDCTQTGNNTSTYAFTYSIYRECQLNCSCGWADNASLLCVWNSTGCAAFTFAHENNHKCVNSTECDGFGDPLTRYCINQCYQNGTSIYFADNSTKMCVLVCPANPNFFGDNSTKSCVFNCPNITVRDPQGQRRCVNLTACSISPLYLYGDYEKNLCVNALNCSDGYYADNNTHQCINICPGPTLLYADNVTKQCVSVCELGWYALNVTAGKGICSLYCPQGLWADNKTVTCTPRCSNNTYGVNSTENWTSFGSPFGYYGICQNECPDGQFARDSDNLCVFDCGPSLWGDVLSKTCKTSPFDCSPGYYADNNTNLCVVPLNCSIVFSVQYVADNLTQTCVYKCPDSVHNFADMNKFLCVSQCPYGYYGHNSTLVCQTNCTSSNYTNSSNSSTYDGSYADPQLNICVEICSATPISTFGQNVTYTCVEPIYCPPNTWAQVKVYKRKCWGPCPPPNSVQGTPQTYGDNITRTCVTSCPTYTFNDLSRGYGLCVNVCPSLINGTLQFADRLTQNCVTVCPSSNSTFGDNYTLSCVYNCPSGSFAQPLPSRYCVAVCSLGTWGETVKNRCVSSPLSCPTVNGSLYYGDNTTTMCVKTCPAANPNMNITGVNNSLNDTNGTSNQDYWGENTTRLCLPSCLLANGVQSGFKWNKTRVCIKQCPAEIGQDGSFSDQGMCYGVCMTANYFRDPQNKRSCQPTCTFTPNKQYADNTTMRCVPKCPTYPMQLYAYDPTKTCESTCPNFYRKYEALKTCVEVCPNGTLFNPDTYQCLSTCPLQTSTNKTLFIDNLLSEPACVINTDCPPNYYADSIVGLCVQNCTEDQWIYGKDCVQICPNGYYGNPNNFTCVIPQDCPTNYFANDVTVTCVPQCLGSFGDPNTHKCVTRCPIIGSDYYYADPITRLCSTTCTDVAFIRLIKNNANQTCISVCEPGFFMNPLSPYNGTCRQSCTGGYYADNSTRLCVAVCPSSPYLFGQNQTYTCVEDCLVSTQFKYINGRVCVTNCPSGTFRDNKTRICEYTCTGYTYADTTSQYCVSNCTPKYAYDLTNKCVSLCVSPFYRDPTTYKCVLLCPTYPQAYFQAIDGTDRKCTLDCPAGQFRDFVTMSCVSLCSASPMTFADNTTKNCLAVCSLNFFGYIPQRTCRSSCPTGMFADNLTRMCVSKCDPDLGLFGDSALPIDACVSVCSDSTYADPYSQTCVNSCINYPKMYKFYNGDLSNPVRTCVYSCPYPYTADSSSSSCKLTCNSPNYPYVDQSLQSCVAKCTTPVYQYAYMPIGSTVNGNCVKFCPNGTFALRTNNSCVSKCPDGLYGSTTNNTCTASCTLADNYYADPYNNLCTPVCTHSSTYFSYADEFTRTCVQTCPQNKSTYGDKLNWKCMKRCSNISQFADPGSRTCVSECPPNYFADIVTQTCVLNCSINTLRYGDNYTRVCVTTCLNSTLYADDSTRLCVMPNRCPSGFFGQNTTKVCVARCPTTPDLFGDPISKTCISKCQPNYFADYVSRTCRQICPTVPALFAQNVTQICVSNCPGSFADNHTRYCIANCSTIPVQTFADNTTYQCVQTCPSEPDYYASNYTWECVNKCPSTPSMYADNSTRSCVYYCPRGLINTYADDSTRRCVDICPGATYNENSTHQCLSRCLTGYADPDTKYCIAVCPHYTYADDKTRSCVTECPIYNGQQTYAEDGNNICMTACLAVYNTFRDSSTNRCVKICPINSSFFADLTQRQCVSICPIYTNLSLTYADSSTRYCVPVCPRIPALFAANITNSSTLYRLCVASCPLGTWSDNNTRSCLPICITNPETFGDNSTWACVTRCPTKPYTFANNHSHTCVPVCPNSPDFYGDNITQKCVLSCPNMTFADPISRRCVTTCPLGYFGQNTTRRCVRWCPWRQFADNLTHLCLAKCSVDPILYGNPDNLLCVPQCPQSNSSFGNPLTQQCVDYQADGTSGCPTAYFADNLTRLCVQVCPKSQDTYGDNTTWKCVIQCPIVSTSPTVSHNTYADNSTMRCVPVCPSYPDFYGEPYSRRCVHFCLKATSSYSGSFSDNSTRTCVEQCPRTPDYFSDNSTGRCVYYCPRYPLTFADNVTRRCVTQCPVATPAMYGDLKTLRCVTRCPQDQKTFGDITSRLCVLTCPSDPPLYANNFTQTCVIPIGCSNGSFADNLTRICVKVCPRYPETYGDPTTSECVSVCPSSPQSLFADPNTQVCISRCPNGLFAENTTRRCVQTCLYNFTNYADNSTNTCVSRCPANLTYGDNGTRRCVTQCPSQPKTFADNITQTCLAICTNVSNGGYADNISRVCVVKCPDLSYGDITTRYCVRYCPVGWYAYTITNLCVQNCPSPYFADNSTRRCVLKCPVGQTLFGQTINNTCVGVCPEGTYASEQNQRCVTRCPNKNETILGYNTWGFNDTNYCVDQCPIVSNVDLYGYPVGQVCVNICPNPFYPNITDHLCYLCPLECASCAYPQLCLTCNVNHYLYSGACVQSCPTFPVITYANPNRVCGTAFQCTQGYYALNATKSCVRTCPAGFYVNIVAQTCDSCMKGCTSCKTGSVCLICNTNVSVWSNNTCYLFCSTKNRFYGKTGCVAQCPSGTYLSITTCKSCDATCKTCSVTAQNCLICANGLYQSNGICVSTCPTNTMPKLVDGSQSCVSCSITDCTQKPLTFSTTQFSSNMQYTVQVQFNQAVNITQQINSVIQLQQSKTTRLLETSSQDLNYTIVDHGNGLYSFVFNDYTPSSNSQIQVQITNPSAIVGPNGQIPSTTRSSINVDSSLIYSLSDYHQGIDTFLYAICMIAFVLLIFTFSADHSIWMPTYDFLQLVMALIFVNNNYPPDLLYSIWKIFASALTFLPNFFTSSFSRATFNPEIINNNIYSVMQDSSFLRVMGHLYFVFIILCALLTLVFIFSKKSPNKDLKKWCKQFIKETFWKKHLHGLISFFFLPVFLFGIFNMQLYSYFSTEPIQGFSIFSSYLFMVCFLIPIFYWIYKLRRTIKSHPIVYLMLQKAYNFILLQQTVLIENKNNCFTHQNNEVDLSNTREPKINELLIFPYPIETKVGPWQVTQPFVNYAHKLLTAIFLSMSFSNPVVQIIFLILINIAYMIYFIIRRPFFRVKNREYNNQIYIHNLLIVSLVEVVLLIFVFMSSQLPTSSKVMIGDIICGLIIEGALVNIVYFFIRAYNYHHKNTWQPFVRSDMFRINYTSEYLQWTKQYDEKEKKLMGAVRPRNEFLQAVKVETGEALANMVRQVSVSATSKQKMKALQLRPSRGSTISKEYGDIITSIANDKQKSHKSLASSERLSKVERKKVRDAIFGERQQKINDNQKYEKLEMIDEQSEIRIEAHDPSEQEENQTEYEYEFIQEQYPEGTPMEVILKGCKKGDIALPF